MVFDLDHDRLGGVEPRDEEGIPKETRRQSNATALFNARCMLNGTQLVRQKGKCNMA